MNGDFEIDPVLSQSWINTLASHPRNMATVQDYLHLRSFIETQSGLAGLLGGPGFAERLRQETINGLVGWTNYLHQPLRWPSTNFLP